MYRVATKTNKRTEYACLKCKHCEVVEKGTQYCFVECKADNKGIFGVFDARYFYCKEHKSYSEMTANEIEADRKKMEEKYADKKFREYVNKYYTKKQAKTMIAERKHKRNAK